MELPNLRTFLVVAEEQNLHRARTKLHLTQSTLSRQIKALEEQLGTELFERQGRRLRLTNVGTVFLGEARKIVAAAETAKYRTHQAALGRLGNLNISLNFVTFRRSVVLDSIREFRLKYPDVIFSLYQMNSSQQFDALRAGEIDAGYVFNFYETSPDFESFQIGSDHYVLALPKLHHLASASKIMLRDLVEEPFIWVERSNHPSLHDRLMSECLKGGLTPRIGQYVVTWSLTLDLVSAGIGLAFVVASAETYTEGVVFKKVEDLSIPARFELTWRRNDQSPVLSLFLRTVTSLYSIGGDRSGG
jgi:DNA-binding transcriptional LysR family regulator